MTNFGTLQSEDSPGPEVIIRLFNPVDPNASDVNTELVEAIIDTGAETSAVPEYVIKSLVEKSGYEVENDIGYMITPDGSSARVYFVRLSVSLYDHSDLAKFATIPPQELDFVSIPKADYAIIGRDYLKYLKISIDFNSQHWSFCNAESCSLS